MERRSAFLDAVRLLTIVPVGSAAEAPPPDWLARAMKFFPLVGVFVGLAGAAVLLLAGQVWGSTTAALLAVATTIAITGAFHEDGLADTFDALGGWSVEKRLAIMKDSRLGTYGALALGIGVALRVAVLASLPLWLGAAALVASHAVARAMPLLLVRRMRYAGDTAGMKVPYVESPLRPDEMIVALTVAALAALPLLMMAPLSLGAGLVLAAGMAAVVAAGARRLLGGYTGDVLGAIEQFAEIGFLLGIAALI